MLDSCPLSRLCLEPLFWVPACQVAGHVVCGDHCKFTKDGQLEVRIIPRSVCPFLQRYCVQCSSVGVLRLAPRMAGLRTCVAVQGASKEIACATFSRNVRKFELTARLHFSFGRWEKCVVQCPLSSECVIAGCLLSINSARINIQSPQQQIKRRPR